LKKEIAKKKLQKRNCKKETAKKKLQKRNCKKETAKKIATTPSTFSFVVVFRFLL
jgi:hypothetical protein